MRRVLFRSRLIPGLNRARTVNPRVIDGGGAHMTDTYASAWLEPDPNMRLAEQAVHAGARADQALQQAKAAQRSAADSLQRSAESHERTAVSYELAAERSDQQGMYLQHAARHRAYANEDRQMAERLRQVIDGNATGADR
jgi:hypothetical protein